MTETRNTAAVKTNGYLTRAEAVRHMTAGRDTTGAQADATLDSALALYPGCARTNYLLITGYKAGTCMGAWPDGITTEPFFTICRW